MLSTGASGKGSMGIRGKNVVITGASTGIGRDTAVLLAGKGARVWAAARDEGRLKELAAEHKGIEAVRCDVTVAADREALLAVASADRPIDVLVNNAGFGWHAFVDEMTEDEVRRMYETNVIALIALTQGVLPAMMARKHGQIINLGSVVGFVAPPSETVYASTKFAVHGFTEGLRRELIGTGVTATLICPGRIKTEFATRSLGGAAGQEDMKGLPVSMVSRAIARSITMRKVPGYQTISIPRVGGFSRLAVAPGMARLADLSTLKFAQRRTDIVGG
jgi:short-subunit dehydrogenase